jgi:hypothetical protein
MNERVQIIVTPAGERLAVLPEADYLLLLAASEDDEGEVRPEFLEEIRRRRSALAASRMKGAEDANPAPRG